MGEQAAWSGWAAVDEGGTVDVRGGRSEALTSPLHGRGRDSPQGFPSKFVMSSDPKLSNSCHLSDFRSNSNKLNF